MVFELMCDVPCTGYAGTHTHMHMQQASFLSYLVFHLLHQDGTVTLCALGDNLHVGCRYTGRDSKRVFVRCVMLGVWQVLWGTNFGCVD